MNLINIEDYETKLLSIKDKVKDLSRDEIASCYKDAIEYFLDKLNSGEISIAYKLDSKWCVNEAAKLAILLSFRLRDNKILNNIQDFQGLAYDKFDSRFYGWDEKKFIDSQIRVLPGGFVRYGSYVGKNTVLLPCFINIGAYIDSGSMIDTWSTIGSCAYIGKNVHISGGVGIGGVLEPIGAKPVIIEDDCFIGARSEICEGVVVGKGSVIGMGCYIGSSTKIINRTTGEIITGYIPPYSVVVPGSYSSTNVNGLNLSTYCVLIIKTIDEAVRKKTSLNELLRM